MRKLCRCGDIKRGEITVTKLAAGLTEKQHNMLERILKLSTDSSAVALSEMTEKSIFLKAPKLGVGSLDSIIDMAGGYETIAISVCLIFDGDIKGNMLLVFPGKSAFKLVDLVMQAEANSQKELDEMAISVLGEVGNLVSAYFLSTLSDYTGMDLRPSSPMLTQDMIGAIISTAMLMLARAPEEVLFIETEISGAARKIDGYLMLFTDEDSLKKLLHAIEKR